MQVFTNSVPPPRLTAYTAWPPDVYQIPSVARPRESAHSLYSLLFFLVPWQFLVPPSSKFLDLEIWKLSLVSIPILPGIQSCSKFYHLYLQTHPWSFHPTHLPYWPGPWPPSSPWSFKVFKVSSCTYDCYLILFSTIQSDLLKTQDRSHNN